MSTHVYLPAGKQHPLLFQQLTLLQGTPRRVGRTGQETSSRADHPVPGQSQRTTVHGPTHLTGEVGGADEGGDLPVGQHPAARDGAHHAVHLLEKGSFSGVRQKRAPTPPRGSSVSETAIVN